MNEIFPKFLKLLFIIHSRIISYFQKCYSGQFAFFNFKLKIGRVVGVFSFNGLKLESNKLIGFVMGDGGKMIGFVPNQIPNIL